ncbi:hypothetical protein [Actinoplanes palleronii]|uniref:Lipoprotein n=1 Tax=Actinoplanes palleronii TaxID=113570 RepID=A0ABQ4B132_9ACTN|nr:hypothetical protein [Actinoplanes palleronii]GIE64378.1 hypothetical protein Apa02nite_004860 [Actinoplanes palleronii]
MLIGLLAGGLLVAAAGCTAAEPAPADPLAQVRAAAAKTASAPARVTMSVPNVDVAGGTDPAGRALTLTVTTDMDGEKVKEEVRVLGDQAYLMLGKSAWPGLDKKFIAFSTAEFATASMVHLGDPFDPTGAKGLTAAATSAQRTADGAYTGTIDLSAAPGATSRGLVPATAEQLERAGDVLTAIPFEASVDGEGRLTALTLKLPAYGTVPAYDSMSRYSAFGEPVTVTAPAAAELAQVPDALRKLLTHSM